MALGRGTARRPGGGSHTVPGHSQKCQTRCRRAPRVPLCPLPSQAGLSPTGPLARLTACQGRSQEAQGTKTEPAAETTFLGPQTSSARRRRPFQTSSRCPGSAQPAGRGGPRPVSLHTALPHCPAVPAPLCDCCPDSGRPECPLRNPWSLAVLELSAPGCARSGARARGAVRRAACVHPLPSLAREACT